MRKKASRAELKETFRSKHPLQEGFPLYIDSTVNIRDDKINLEGQKGMVLYAHGEEGHTLALSDVAPEGQAGQLDYRLDLPQETEESPSSFHLRGLMPDFGLWLNPEGRVGIGASPPQADLDVDGIVGADALIGTYAWGEIPADGQWHPTEVRGLTQGNHAYEVTAYIGDERDERYALTHGVAMVEIGRRKARSNIDLTQAASKWLWGRRLNYIQVRWAAAESEQRSPKLYELQLRTRTHYDLDEEGEPKLIFYRLHQIFLPK